MAHDSTRRESTALEDTAPRPSRPAARALLPLAVGPVLWFAHLNVSYGLVPSSCSSGQRWPFGLVTLVAVAGIAVVTVRAWRAWESDRRAEPSGLAGFLGLLGVCLGVLFAAGTLVVGASVLVVSPCH